jgi:thioredoxin-like negative regulator of GroEL
MPGRLQKLTAEEFMDHVISKESNALVEVGAAWSGSSQMVLSTLTTMTRQQELPLHLYHIDSEINPFIHKLYNIDSLPALLFFRKGILVDKLSGLSSRASITEKINQHFIA